MQEITLKLTIDQVNQVLNSLAQQPYIKVNDLIVNLRGQAQAQISEVEENGGGNE